MAGQRRRRAAASPPFFRLLDAPSLTGRSGTSPIATACDCRRRSGKRARRGSDRWTRVKETFSPFLVASPMAAVSASLSSSEKMSASSVAPAGCWYFLRVAGWAGGRVGRHAG